MNLDLLDLQLPSKVQPIKYKLFEEKNINVFVKRDDLIHPIISGNKFRKLKFNLIKLNQKGYKTLLTFGGAYSNHLMACAYACKKLNIKLVAVIRGEKPKKYSPVLTYLVNQGAKMHFISRTDYKLKENEHFIADLRNQFGEVFIVPEGGANFEGTAGCADILKEQDLNPNYIFVAAGTGTTAAGLLPEALKRNSLLYAIQVLKGQNYIKNEIKNRLQYSYFDNDLVADLMRNITVLEQFHFGGYAKTKPELLNFIKQFQSETKIPLDFIYNGKMFYALCEEIRNNNIKSGSSVLALHTGGTFSYNLV
jgi:1-aminocyclopropane-1-carboxylate deaminase